MTITSYDDQGAYTDTGVASLPTPRPSTVAIQNPPLVVDTGTVSAKTPVPPARAATGQRR